MTAYHLRTDYWLSFFLKMHAILHAINSLSWKYMLSWKKSTYTLSSKSFILLLCDVYVTSTVYIDLSSWVDTVGKYLDFHCWKSFRLGMNCRSMYTMSVKGHQGQWGGGGHPLIFSAALSYQWEVFFVGQSTKGSPTEKKKKKDNLGIFLPFKASTVHIHIILVIK